MWLQFECNNVRGEFDLEQDELKGFALSLVDLAVDCLRKYEGETEDIDEVLCQAIELMN